MNQRGQPFEVGNKLGKGRPRGSANKANLAERLLEEHAEPLMRKCIIDALKGDPRALRLCIERLVAPRRDSFVRFPVRPTHSAAGVATALDAVFKGLACGQITPDQAVCISSVLEKRAQLVASVEFEQRLDKLEAEQQKEAA